MSSKLKNYIEDRYGNLKIENADLIYTEYLKQQGIQIHSNSHGFFTYKMSGDALIISDVFVDKEARRQSVASQFLKTCQDLMKDNGLAVMIGFSEFEGQNHEDGKGLMKALGFKKAFNTSQKEVYIYG